MRYLSVLYASLRALMIAALAGGGGAQAQVAGDQAEAAAWAAARSVGTAEAYQRYLELYPVGQHAGQAFHAIIELTVVPGVPTGAASRGLGLDMY